MDTIIKYHSNGSNEFNLALDVACGPGTGVTPYLIDNFARVIGCDRNARQLDVARKSFGQKDKVMFRQSDAEELGWVEDASVDMITCCAAMHCKFETCCGDPYSDFIMIFRRARHPILHA